MRLLMRLRNGLCLWLLLGAGFSIADAQTPLARVERIDRAQKPALVNLPAGAPQAVLYYLDKSRATSCGLLPSNPGASVITPILETEPGENFPFCLDVTDAAAFQSSGGTGFVFKYSQQDTREDVSTGYSFVQQSNTHELKPLDQLNGETIPEKKSISYVAAWAESKLIGLANEKEAYQTSQRDSIITDTAFLNLSRNAAVGKCRTSVDWVATHSNLSPVTAPCKSILASTYWASSKGTCFFIVLIKADDDHTTGQIFMNRNGTVSEAAELEAQLKPEISSGKILRVKQALRKLVTTC